METAIDRFKHANPKTDGVGAWIRKSLRADTMMYMVATLILGPIALLAVLAMYAFALVVGYFILSQYIEFRGIPFPLHLAAAGFVFLLFWLNRNVEHDAWAPVRIRNEEVNTVVRVSQMTGAGWLLLLQSPRDMNPALRFVTNLLLFAPRLFDLFMAVCKRVISMRTIDLSVCSKAVTLLMNARGRVNLAELVREFPTVNPQDLVDDLSAVDGVVFLTNDPPGVTLSPMVVEEYMQWRDEQRAKSASA
ncbi:hypothetical protein [Calycomorphotria hydatis]|uniref:Uncharacterized protein n=1 Tax=Calycomorphotria hydatis TaxID=2528027 RepID=A0A517TBZ6_9PLAN|nr:hypothetical protein [Calycomorphotria hydatis]QDT65905.1 hypothetical protein V22_31680 [Calycomorphotria hydatis]